MEHLENCACSEKTLINNKLFHPKICIMTYSRPHKFLKMYQQNKQLKKFEKTNSFGKYM